VIAAETSEDALALFESQKPAAVVVEAGTERELDKLTEAIRKVNPRTPVVILAESAVVAENVRSLVDAMVLKAQAPSVLAHKLNSLIQIRSHSHPQLEGKYVAFSDSSRHYVDCSDGVCDLLGYTRMELTGMTIDEASYRPQKVCGMFQEYMEKGKLEGQYILRHKSGKPVFIQYRSEIFPDGCMAAVWEPVEDWKQLYQSAMLEFDRTKLKDRVDVAQHAIEDRLRDLGQDRGGSSPECQQLRDALSGLRVLSREIVQV
jgi:PAS domain-containing protein